MSNDNKKNFDKKLVKTSHLSILNLSVDKNKLKGEKGYAEKNR